MNQPVFIGCPTHDGRIVTQTARSLYVTATQKYTNSIVQINNGSLLASNCNQLWAMALNMRDKYNIKWFAMLHSDIVPEAWWLDRMIDIAESNAADFLSAVVPIKDDRGLTSTAIADPDDNFWNLTRLTLRQMWHDQFPETFDAAQAAEALRKMPADIGLQLPAHGELLCNTGLMVCRLDKHWSDKVFFTITDKIIPPSNGFGYRAANYPEDWFFSQRIAQLGGRVMATRAVQNKHVGIQAFESNQLWGAAIDPESKLLKTQMV